MNKEINLDKGIKRQKRRTSKNRQSLIISNENQSNLFKESNNITKMNNKENPKKGAKKNKKKLSEKEQISPGNNKQKKIDICENNFILNFSPDNNNLLTLAKKSEENNIKKTTEKINIITYKLDPKEIQCLQSLNNFEFKGNIDNKDETQKNKSLYDSANIIITTHIFRFSSVSINLPMTNIIIVGYCKFRSPILYIKISPYWKFDALLWICKFIQNESYFINFCQCNLTSSTNR
jgi:hypothetical protein